METWREVDGFGGLYEVSDLGNVRSVDRRTRDGRFWKGRSLGKYTAGSGYKSVVLSVDGVYHREYIHRLVAKAFIPNPYGKPEVNHIDGDKTNNCVGNLEWVTKSENGLHSYRVLGRKPSCNGKGKPSGRRKLTDSQVAFIRQSKESNKALARKFCVSDAVIRSVRAWKTYKVDRDGNSVIAR